MSELFYNLTDEPQTREVVDEITGECHIEFAVPVYIFPLADDCTIVHWKWCTNEKDNTYH